MNRNERLTRFAESVLTILEAHDEWSGATTDAIASAAFALGLAHTDEHAMFMVTIEKAEKHE
jgi:hypothetical protein